MTQLSEGLPELPEPSAWFFRRWWSAKVELTTDRPNPHEGEVTPLYTAENCAAAIRALKAEG
jgi:hypothetical protein